MADKKINQLDDAATLTVNDYWPVNQDHASGKALKGTLGALRTFILGGANAGARIYFTVGTPGIGLGVDGDVAFDQNNRIIYQKSSSIWVNKGKYSSVADYVRFTSVYGSGGLAADGLSYTNTDLIDATITSVKVEADELIPVATLGDTPLFDEFDFDDSIGKLIFGAALPAGFRITIIYSK